MSPGVSDANMGNSDHLPVWVEGFGNHTWGDKSGEKRRSARTGGKEKERFTVQLTCYKNGDKGRPFIIFKAARAPKGKEYGNKKSVTYEIAKNLPDKWGNDYPPRDDCYITVPPLPILVGSSVLKYSRIAEWMSWESMQMDVQTKFRAC